MPSPFPGMDPYIEQPDLWADFCSDLASEIRRCLNQQILPRYVARITARVGYEVFQNSVEVHETGSLRLVTAIEILSPVDKQPSHDAYPEYLRKRRDMLRSQANFLELDLLRAGTRPPLNKPVPPAPYYITLSRVTTRPRVDVWPIQIWEELPTIPVPLLDPDPDAVLEIGQLVKDIYERGAYHVLIDYNQPPPPPALDRADQAWVDRLLRGRSS